MPVVEHAIHPSTQIGKEWRYGCWNLSRHKRPVRVQDGYRMHKVEGNTITEIGVFRYVPDVFSEECRHDMSLSDWACEGCEHRGTGEEYARMVKENACS